MEMFCSSSDLGFGCRDAACRGFELPVERRASSPVPRNSVNLELSRGGLQGVAPEPLLKLLQGKFTLQSMAFFTVADLSVKGG
jgi:hypothetical protein